KTKIAFLDPVKQRQMIRDAVLPGNTDHKPEIGFDQLVKRRTISCSGLTLQVFFLFSRQKRNTPDVAQIAPESIRLLRCCVGAEYIVVCTQVIVMTGIDGSGASLATLPPHYVPPAYIMKDR